MALISKIIRDRLNGYYNKITTRQVEKENIKSVLFGLP